MCGLSVVAALKRSVSIKAVYNGYTSSAPDGHGLKTGSTNGIANGAQPSTRSDLESRLSSSLDKIAHRGPDARDIWISPDNTVGLAHCRLSINDLSSDGVQPLHDDEGHIHAVVNGEIYDNDRLREQCIRATGYKFKGHSDSETVVALYKQYGAPGFLEHMRGEFSLVIYDDRTGDIIAARDRFGIKPLFWTVVGDELLIASEMKAFLPLGWAPEWDVESICLMSCFNAGKTMFKDVRRVEPGHYMTVSPDGDIKQNEYWDFQYPNKYKVEERSVEDMVLAVREKIIESVRLRLRADVPVGIYLSGGLDSSAVAGIVKHLVQEEGEKMGNLSATERIACFSIAFDKDSGYDESDIAARTADYLGVQMHTIHMNEAELARHFEDSVWHNEQYTFDLNTVGKFALSELPRRHGFKVILSGEGADELFAGYPWFPSDFLLEPDYSQPELALQQDDALRRELHEKSLRDFKASLAAMGDSGQSSESFQLQLDPDLSERLNHTFSPAAFSASALVAPVFAAPLRARYPPAARVRAKVDAWPAPAQERIRRDWHPLHAAMYAWNKTFLPNLLLTSLGDRSEMAHGVEGRPPFLDHELAALVGGLPPSVKMRYCGPGASADRSAWWWSGAQLCEKWVLREAARPFVTEELYRRRKHPYTAPVAWPRGGPLHRLFARLLTRESVGALGFLDWPGVRDALGRAFGEGADPAALRQVIAAAGLVTMSRRFGVPAAG
ncbi:asparagine synthase [Biscogniauxia mediterranea]|nr:asparagine synthase [Biscogniauxia mediterranea]